MIFDDPMNTLRTISSQKRSWRGAHIISNGQTRAVQQFLSKIPHYSVIKNDSRRYIGSSKKLCFRSVEPISNIIYMTCEKMINRSPFVWTYIFYLCICGDLKLDCLL